MKFVLSALLVLCTTLSIQANAAELPPNCSITGALYVCSNSAGNLFTAPAGMTSYSWSITGAGTIQGSTTGQTVSVTAGNYTQDFTLSLTIDDGTGPSTCFKQVYIFYLTPPATITVNPATACMGVSFDLSISALASSTVLWTGNGITNPNGNPSTTAIPTTTGNLLYNVQVNAANGCVNTGTATVTVNATPNAAIAVTENNVFYNPFTNLAYYNVSYTDGVLCTGPGVPNPSTSATLTASGGGTYLWSTGATTPAITVSTAGTYTVVVTGTGGCTASASKTISVNSAPSAGTISATPSLPSSNGFGLCENATLTLSSTVPGGVWVAYDKSPNPNVVSTDPVTGFTIPLYNSFTVDSHSVFYRVTLNGCINSARTTVVILDAPNAGTISGTTTLCAGTTTQLSSNGTTAPNTIRTWSSSNTSVATVNATSGLVSGMAGGTATITYTVTTFAGTLSNPTLLCTKTATTVVTVNTLPNAGGISGTTTVCSGLSTQLTSNGDAGGTWGSGNPAAATVVSSSGLVSGIAAGTSLITYTVTSAFCNSSSTNVLVTVNNTPVVTCPASF
ncbi:MAG: Ig-like domain-containing protein, partial [Saprospiraceae bacterium]|nr:Ig-like domain-containing protein [Saprospiraceae bacterium]